MRTIKEYLKENFFGNLGIGKKANIENWLNKNCKFSQSYIINSDFTIDTNGNVRIEEYFDKEFPEYIQFNYVKGIFNVSNSNLTSLKGCPNKCSDFYCYKCNSLTSLEGAPKECEYFNCFSCKSLTSLEGAPKNCKTFNCSNCEKLTSLKGAPEKCEEEFNCSNCNSLTSIKGASEKCKNFSCNYCSKLTSLEGAPNKCRIFNCQNCKGKFTEEDVRKYCNAKIIYC